MRSLIVVGLVLLGASTLATTADAKGCIKGAIIGGIAGHYAGHGKIGAVAGCVIGRREANKADAARVGERNRTNRPTSDDGRI